MKKKRVTKYICEICKKEHSKEKDALKCEERCKKWKATRDKENKEVEALKAKGFDVWYEYSGRKHAPKVDGKRFGTHAYDSGMGTSDCRHGCGCWMGPSRSGGPVNPLGACPKNPKPEPTLEDNPVYATGYFAKEQGSRGKLWSGVHVTRNGKPICGYKPAKGMKFQWCARKIYLPYVECKACKERVMKKGLFA